MRLHRNIVDQGFPNYPKYFFNRPALQLNENFDSLCYDTVALTYLIDHFKFNKVLDFGCFLGMIPVHVEDLLRSANSIAHVEWTLVDNFSLHNGLNTETDSHGRPRTMYDTFNKLKNTWSDDSSELIKIVGNKIPTDPDSVIQLIDRITSALSTPRPKIKTLEFSLDKIKGKFDTVLFDLLANENNSDLINLIIDDYLTDNGIIVLDDVKPKWPIQLATYYKLILNKTVLPFAFSNSKVFLIKSNVERKKELLDSIQCTDDNFCFNWKKLDIDLFGPVLTLL